MRTTTHILPERLGTNISRIVHDSRFWAIIGIIIFIAIFASLIIWSAQTGTTNSSTYYWPYGPGPVGPPMGPVPMH